MYLGKKVSLFIRTDKAEASFKLRSGKNNGPKLNLIKFIS